MQILTLTTCHNRCDKTLKSLANLQSQKLPSWVTVEHVLVDDGSVDRTADVVKFHFPNVEIIKGNGGLFWSGGMRLGWETSIKWRKFDFLLVYNDDIELDNLALMNLINSSRHFSERGGVSCHIIVGAFKSAATEMTTYSGMIRSSWWHPLRFVRAEPPNTGYLEVDTLNMNCCLITSETLRKFGFLSEYFVHGGADFEYGIKVKSGGGKILLTSGHIGYCERNDCKDNFITESCSLFDCYKKLLSIKHQPFYQRFYYFKDHGGIFWFVLFLAPYISLIFRYFLSKIAARCFRNV